MDYKPTEPKMEFTNTENWLAPSGAKLRIYHQKAYHQPKAVIHINHGLAEHAARYARFANFLSNTGYEVYAQDHRGHGATTAPDAYPAVFSTHNGWNKVLSDINFVNKQIRIRHPNLPIVLFGHSMGAMLAYNYLLRWPDTINAAAIWNADLSKNPALKLMGLILAIESRIKGKNSPSIVSKLTFEAFNKKFKPNATSCDWLSKDIDECKAYEADKLCGWAPSVSMWQDLLGGILYAVSDNGLEKIDKKMPIHILGGDADPSIRNAKAQEELAERLEKKGFDNIHLVIRKNGRHEALNEPKLEREKVMSDFIKWLDEIITNLA